MNRECSFCLCCGECVTCDYCVCRYASSVADDVAEADAYYAELKARLDERAPA